jgi:NAD(P)-dependent dehydrogenase (short-subunit alcohol dehydrogenase family)
LKRRTKTELRLTRHGRIEGRIGTINDVTCGVLYLERAPFVTGEFLHVDGGQSAGE